MVCGGLDLRPSPVLSTVIPLYSLFYSHSVLQLNHMSLDCEIALDFPHVTGSVGLLRQRATLLLSEPKDSSSRSVYRGLPLQP